MNDYEDLGQPVQPTADAGLSRRGVLGAVGAGAAALAGGQLLGGQPAAASDPPGVNYYMKWGAVCSPPGDFNRKVNILRRIRPQTVRVSMFWGSPGTRRFSNWHLDQLLGTGLNEMIIQSSEDPDPNLAYNELNTVLGYIDAHPNILFVFELGNEPDYHTDPWLARWKRLATLRDNKWRQDRGNLLWAVNMPAGRFYHPTRDPGFRWTSGQYFDAFVRDTGDGLGNMIGSGYAPYKPDVITAHAYSWDYLRRYTSRGEDNPYKMIDYVRGWDSRVSMKITEAGIDGRKSDRGYRYRDFGQRIDDEAYGQIDSVCFYGLPDVEREYSILEWEADQLGTHA